MKEAWRVILAFLGSSSANSWAVATPTAPPALREVFRARGWGRGGGRGLMAPLPAARLKSTGPSHLKAGFLPRSSRTCTFLMRLRLVSTLAMSYRRRTFAEDETRVTDDLRGAA